MKINFISVFLHKWKKTLQIIMRTFLFLCFTTAFSFAPNNAFSQNAKVKIEADVTLSVAQIFELIQQQAGYKFVYSDELIAFAPKVRLKKGKIRVKELLKSGLSPIYCTFEFTKNETVVVKKIIQYSPKESFDEVSDDNVQFEINGAISDSDGQPLPGASIVEKGTTNGTQSDFEGNFTLEIADENAVLVISYLGFETKEVVVGNQTTLSIHLNTATANLNEVVVTALGIKREVRALGFSMQKIGEDDLDVTRASSITSYITGKIAGVQVSKTASGAGGSTNVVIRGNSSIGSNNQPLYVVDGVPIVNYSNSFSGSSVSSANLDYGDGIGDINPEDVESMSVLKGPAASALYGSRGANGVIIITTKSGKVGARGLGVEINSGVFFEDLYLIPKFQNKFGSGYGDEGYANYSWGGFTFDDIYYNWPENGSLDSWGGPLDGSTKIPNWWTLPADGSIPSSVWDNPITEAIPYVAQPIDNVRNFFNTGYTFTNNIAVTSASEKSSMRLSLGNVSTTGIVPNHKLSRKSISFRGATRLSEVISFEGKVNYIRTEGEQRPSTGYSDSNPLFNLIQMARNTPLDFVKYQYETTKVNIRYPGVNYNPYYMVNEIKNKDFKDRFIGFVSLDLNLTDWLTAKGRVGIDFYSSSKEVRWPKDGNSKNRSSRKGQLTQNLNTARDINADVMLTANKKISNNIALNGVVGARVTSFRSDNMFWDAREFKSDDVYDISNFNDVRPSSNLFEKEMQSAYFTGQVAYKDFLFLDITGRNDWSSALGLDNQSYFYPSISTSFVFSDALDINKNILSFGKIRASWAQVGNDAQPYLTQSGYSLYATGFDGNPYASKSGTIPLWDLKNELTESVEFGVDLRFLNNRVSLDMTYYDATTSNQILGLAISRSSGYSNTIVNAGEIKNKGIEVSLGITPIKSEDFKWNINANFAKNESEIVVLDGNIQTYRLIRNNSHASLSDIHAQVGAPYGNIIGYAYKKAPDGQRIVSASGKYQRENETSVLGNITPDWIGGLNNTFSYKGFSLNVLLDFVQGGEVVSATKYEMTRKGTGAWTVEGRRPQPRYLAGDEIPSGSSVGDPMPYTGVLDGVVDNGDGTFSENTQAVSGQDYWASRGWGGISEEFVEDGSYISLREVILSYNLNPSILEKTPFTALTISAIGRNLTYLQNGMDHLGLSPESAPNTAGGASGIESLAVPSTRSYGLNLKLAF